MAEKKEKNYVASSIKKISGQYGDFFNANFKLEDLKKMEKRGWVSLVIAERREPSEKGATHYAYENTYEPKEKDNEKVSVSKVEKEEDLPF